MYCRFPSSRACTQPLLASALRLDGNRWLLAVFMDKVGMLRWHEADTVFRPILSRAFDGSIPLPLRYHYGKGIL